MEEKKPKAAPKKVMPKTKTTTKTTASKTTSKKSSEPVILFPKTTMKEITDTIVNVQKEATEKYSSFYRDWMEEVDIFNEIRCVILGVIIIFAVLFLVSFNYLSAKVTIGSFIIEVAAIALLVYLNVKNRKAIKYKDAVYRFISKNLNNSPYILNTYIYDKPNIRLDEIFSNPEDHHYNVLFDEYPLWVLDMLKDKNVTFRITTDFKRVNISIVNNGFSFETYSFDITLEEFTQLTAQADKGIFDFTWLDKRYVKSE